MTKEELSRGIQEIDADLVAEAAFDAHTPEPGRAKEPARVLVAKKRRSGLRAVGVLAAALAVVVAVSAIVAWKPFSRHKPADEAKLSGDGCGALYQMTAHETVRVEGSGFSEEELREYVQSQAGTIAAAVRAEYGITGEIRVCTKGFSRAALGKQNVLNRDSLFLPITRDGTIIGALEVFRADGKPGSSVALGGDVWASWNRVFAEHPDEDLVFVLAGGAVDTAITKDNRVLEIGEGGGRFLDAGVNWYDLLKTEYNVFSAKELARTDASLAVTVNADSFTVEGLHCFQAVVEEINGNAILVREVDSEQSGSEQNETASKEYWLTVSEETVITRNGGEQIELSALKQNDDVLVVYSGEVLETYPMQIPHVSEIRLLEAPEGLRLDRCKLYLTVLEDLWADDPALNSGVKQIGMDLSKLSHLTWEERDYVIRTFARQHGLPCVTGTWEELCDRGLIDRENLLWADGVFLSIETDETAAWNLEEIPVG
ncbi:MAG: YobA family protein, partial [Oscillospiraceae bacterium]|nr:YobA family protein [Oscillospiraceae bacterium]